MPYPIQGWEDFPAGGTAIMAAKLRHMEEWLAESIRLHEFGLGAANVAEVNAGESVNDVTWSDMLTVGPQVNIDLDSSVAIVRAIVFLSAQLRSGFATGVEMGVRIEGPSPREPEQERALRFRPHAEAGDGYIQAATMLPAFALQPGSYTFKAEYRSTEGHSAVINHRRILVVPLPR